MVNGNNLEAKSETLDSSISSLDVPISLLNESIDRLHKIANSIAGQQPEEEATGSIDVPFLSPAHYIGQITQRCRTLNYQVGEIQDIISYLEKSLNN